MQSHLALGERLYTLPVHGIRARSRVKCYAFYRLVPNCCGVTCHAQARQASPRPVNPTTTDRDVIFLLGVFFVSSLPGQE